MLPALPSRHAHHNPPSSRSSPAPAGLVEGDRARVWHAVCAVIPHHTCCPDGRRCGAQSAAVVGATLMLRRSGGLLRIFRCRFDLQDPAVASFIASQPASAGGGASSLPAAAPLQALRPDASPERARRELESRAVLGGDPAPCAPRSALAAPLRRPLRLLSQRICIRSHGSKGVGDRQHMRQAL